MAQKIKTPLTKEQIEELADNIYTLFKENGIWSDTFIYFNGQRLGNKSPDGHYHYDGSAFIEKDMDPRKYFEYVNPSHILSMSFEGPAYEMFNHGEYSSVLQKFDKLLDKYGLYYELGNAWNLTCYYA